jgi:AhpD family alkylhydroperoxidase
MSALQNIGRQMRVLLRARERRLDLPRWLVRRPILAAGIAAAEAAETLSGRADYGLKLLAQSRVAAMVGCEFCLDIGAALAEQAGVSEQKLLDLHRFETSVAFDETERLVLRLATALTELPAHVPAGLREELIDLLGKAAYLELASAIAHEHERTRLYLALGIRPAKFAAEGTCRISAAHADLQAEAATS